MGASVEIFPDSDTMIGAASKRLADTIQSAVAVRERALIVLTGGGNGIGLLRDLNTRRRQIDWTKVHLFWGDERYVSKNDDERNEKQARAALLDHIDIPPSQVHPMPARDTGFGNDLEAAALAYEQLLAANAAPGDPTPNFDVHLLGMGPEGHINSLFPNTAAVRETSRMVLGTEDSPKPPPARITLTIPAIQRSREVWLLVSGTTKADAVAAAMGGAPSALIPAAGAVGFETTLWLLDEEAAAKLPGQRRHNDPYDRQSRAQRARTKTNQDTDSSRTERRPDGWASRRCPRWFRQNDE